MKVTHVTGDDWQAIYVNEDLHSEGHSVPCDIWEALLETRRVSKTDHFECDLDWLSERGGFKGIQLSDVPKGP